MLDQCRQLRLYEGRIARRATSRAARANCERSNFASYSIAHPVSPVAHCAP